MNYIQYMLVLFLITIGACPTAAKENKTQMLYDTFLLSNIQVESNIDFELNMALSSLGETYSYFQNTLSQIKKDAEKQAIERISKSPIARYHELLLTFESMPPNAKMFVLDIINIGKKHSQLPNDILLMQSINSVHDTLIRKWDDKSMAVAVVNADFFLRHLPKDLVDKIFYSLLTERLRVMEKQTAESQAELEQLEQRIAEIDESASEIESENTELKKVLEQARR